MEEIEVELDSHTLYKDNQGWAWPIWRMVPYSHAQKKVQQKEKKKRRQEKDARANGENIDHKSRDELLLSQLNTLAANTNTKIETIFEKESQEEIEARKKKGFEPLDLQHRDYVCFFFFISFSSSCSSFFSLRFPAFPLLPLLFFLLSLLLFGLFFLSSLPH